MIDHDLRTALISPEGRVIHIWKSNFWTPYEIRNRIVDEQKTPAVSGQYSPDSGIEYNLLRGILIAGEARRARIAASAL